MDSRISRLASTTVIGIGLLVAAPALADIIDMDDPVPTDPVSRHLVANGTAAGGSVSPSVKSYARWLAGRPARKEAKRQEQLAELGVTSPTSLGGSAGYSDAFFDCLAGRESGGQALPCARYCGRIQWLPSTWRNAGGTKYAALPQYATWEQEKDVARSWLATGVSLLGQWPPARHCLHLR